jgi:uncharacterized membrane protein
VFSNFFDPSYWFTLRPALVGGLSGNILFGIFVLMFVLGIVARIVSSNKTTDRYARDFGHRLGTLLITMGVLGILLYFFSFERIRLFGSRFLYGLWVIGLLVWGFILARFVRRTIPQKRAYDKEREEQRKYLPSRKK